MGCSPDYGIPTPRRAHVVLFNRLSAHADRNDRLGNVRAITPEPHKVFVVHGEKNKRCPWAPFQNEHSRMTVVVPTQGTPYEI